MKRLLIKQKLPLIFALFLSVIVSCSDDDEPKNQIIIAAGENAAEDAQLAFIDVEEDFEIVFEEGTFKFPTTLSMDGKTNIVIRGAGRDKTILDFSSQSSGGEGVLITNSVNIRIEDLTVRDAKGDALKTRDCNTISFINIGTIWSGEPRTENGAYGLYPVLCSQVYIDGCYAYGASDAGIYVGQSDQVIVKNSVAEGNVAGIEIENTTNADVFDNEAFDNTGGILVFDLPGLTKAGSAVRVFNNNVHDNNRKNFAPAGNIVANVPAGTGMMILSTKFVEIFENDFLENYFSGVLLANYLLVNDFPDDPSYNPWPAGIFVHDNTYTMNGSIDPAIQTPLVQDMMGLIALNGYSQPNILMDGLIMSDDAICIAETSETTFVNLNALDGSFGSVTDELGSQDCTKNPLPEVSFDPF